MANKELPVIQVEDLHVQFKTSVGRNVIAVDGLNLTVNRGEVVGFIGPNGAGKTTTIKVLMGFVKPGRGGARLFGEPAGAAAARSRTGYLPEVAVYYPFLTAREALRLYANLSGIRRRDRERLVGELIGTVGLAGRDRERLSGYSKGMLQRVGIAQAIMGAPDLLILDEITSGLDPVARTDVRGILLNYKSRGKTVFFSSHELTEVALLCDRVILLDNGRIIEENQLQQLLSSLKCIVIRVKNDGRPIAPPENVVARTAGAGVQVFAADSWEAADAFRAELQAQGAQILETTEEPASLEDYFVRKLGHKTT